jgi:hypothetical protein
MEQLAKIFLGRNNILLTRLLTVARLAALALQIGSKAILLLFWAASLFFLWLWVFMKLWLWGLGQDI